MGLVDKCLILFVAGNGGDGIVSWRREAHVPLGGPDGGNGGNGGSIILVGDYNETSLQHLKFRKKIKAEDGGKGSAKKCHGRAGNDIYLKVPLGTILTYEKTNEIITEIMYDKEQFVIATGGRAGNGNANFKSNFNSAPSLYELGDFGEKKLIMLELKTIADVGIVGLPNAGKSTFISMISNAKPKIANYQFTTLSPSLGTIYKDEEGITYRSNQGATYKNNQRIIFADIPGLIKGASDGIGLGHDFLKHIERTKILVHIVSMDNFDNENVIEAYETIKEELKKYSDILDKKLVIIAANKMDSDSAEENFAIFSKYLKKEKIIKISAINSENLSQVVDLSFKLLQDIRKKESLETIEVKYINTLKTKEKSLDKEILIEAIGDRSWRITSEYLEYWTHKIPINTQDNLVRYNQKLTTIGFSPFLLKNNVRINDTIHIYNISLKFEG